jgi:hypothetical protein
MNKADLRSACIVALVAGGSFWYGYGWAKGLQFAASVFTLLLLAILFDWWRGRRRASRGAPQPRA